jgi:hypothetical protein
LGLFEDGQLAVLKPVRQRAVYAAAADGGGLSAIGHDAPIVDDAIAYYESASYLFKHGLQGAIPTALAQAQVRVGLPQSEPVGP